MLPITYAAPTSGHLNQTWSVWLRFLPQKNILNLFSTLNSIEKGLFGCWATSAGSASLSSLFSSHHSFLLITPSSSSNLPPRRFFPLVAFLFSSLLPPRRSSLLPSHILMIPTRRWATHIWLVLVGSDSYNTHGCKAVDDGNTSPTTKLYKLYHLLSTVHILSPCLMHGRIQKVLKAV